MMAKFVNGRQDNWEVYLPAGPLSLQDESAQVYGAHSLRSDAGQGTTK